MIDQSRKNAMREEGYISSETLCNCDDPNLIVVLSMWKNKTAWDNYKNSSARKGTEEKYLELFERPTEYESFDLGLSFAMSENDFVEPLEF